MLIIFEVSQYRARPLGNVRVKKPNIRGIIQVIMRICACCLGSAVTGVVIFCWSHMVPPTRIAMINIGSATARFNQRNWFSRGTWEKTIGQAE